MLAHHHEARLTLTSATPAEKTYDGNPLEDRTVSITSGSLATGDKFVAGVTVLRPMLAAVQMRSHTSWRTRGQGAGERREGAYRNYDVTKSRAF